MAVRSEHRDDGVRFLSREEARELFDARARELMGMSGEEFLQRYDAGEFDEIEDTPEDPGIIHLLMIRPLAG
jgi:hypothetical protein